MWLLCVCTLTAVLKDQRFLSLPLVTMTTRSLFKQGRRGDFEMWEPAAAACVNECVSTRRRTDEWTYVSLNPRPSPALTVVSVSQSTLRPLRWLDDGQEAPVGPLPADRSMMGNWTSENWVHVQILIFETKIIHGGAFTLFNETDRSCDLRYVTWPAGT